MNTITIEKKWSGENLTNRTGGYGPDNYVGWPKNKMATPSCVII